jgi:2-polyprenyl-3-methyl-5-hydroxy-6-metoxy-1,4-benzoquinol methylase
MKCRFDGKPLKHVFVDLGTSPPSNAFLTEDQLSEPEVYYPLKLWVSDRTFLVQVDEVKKATEIFNHEYAYFSSFSSSWLAHCKRYANHAIDRFNLDRNSQVVEIASNDGYLLQYFREKEIPVLGIEPTGNTAKVAIEKGIPTITRFFGVQLAKELAVEGTKADLLIGNNVLAHVPDINDFVGGLKILLNEHGIITMEFPHLLQLILQHQFDTIYHEHFSYFSLYTVQQIFKAHDLEIFDVDELTTHGGSLRIYAQHKGTCKIEKSINELIEKERKHKLFEIDTYLNFQEQIQHIKNDLLSFLIEQKKAGKKVAAYGAAAKGNTLLNYCGIKSDLIAFVADKSPHKQGKYMPGSRIPIYEPDEIKRRKPDYILILPWNIKEEVMTQLSYVKEWGAKFVVFIPKKLIING